MNMHAGPGRLGGLEKLCPVSRTNNMDSLCADKFHGHEIPGEQIRHAFAYIRGCLNVIRRPRP